MQRGYSGKIGWSCSATGEKSWHSSSVRYYRLSESNCWYASTSGSLVFKCYYCDRINKISDVTINGQKYVGPCCKNYLFMI